MRSLFRLRQHFDVLVAVEAPLEVEFLLGPGGEHDLDGLAEAIGAFLDRNVEDSELAGIEAPAGSPVDSPSGEDIE